MLSPVLALTEFKMADDRNSKTRESKIKKSEILQGFGITGGWRLWSSLCPYKVIIMLLHCCKMSFWFTNA